MLAVKRTLEIEAEAPAGFAEVDVGVARDNGKQLEFRAQIDSVRGVASSLIRQAQ